jgi:hypothetical protein
MRVRPTRRRWPYLLTASSVTSASSKASTDDRGCVGDEHEADCGDHPGSSARRTVANSVRPVASAVMSSPATVPGGTDVGLDVGGGAFDEVPAADVGHRGGVRGGLDRLCFITVSASTGDLVEYHFDQKQDAYLPYKRGAGWQGSRLIG